jgi:hypothetical protein
MTWIPFDLLNQPLIFIINTPFHSYLTRIWIHFPTFLCYFFLAKINESQNIEFPIFSHSITMIHLGIHFVIIYNHKITCQSLDMFFHNLIDLVYTWIELEHFITTNHHFQDHFFGQGLCIFKGDVSIASILQWKIIFC